LNVAILSQPNETLRRFQNMKMMFAIERHDSHLSDDTRITTCQHCRKANIANIQLLFITTGFHDE